MSHENVEAFKRALDAYNRQDIEALVEGADPEIEWHSAILAGLGGEATVYRGLDAVREVLRDLYEALGETRIEYPDIRDLGDRVVGIGRTRTRGKGSGAETESPHASVVDFKNGKATRVRSYLDPSEALEAAGISE